MISKEHISPERLQQLLMTAKFGWWMADFAKKHYVSIIEENNDLLLQLISDILDLSKIEAGTEAIYLYQKEHPDIILTDIHMPEMDGLEVSRHIRSKDKKIPIIALTAFDSDKNNTLEAGCNDYLFKPIQARQLKDTIKKLLHVPL